MMPAGKPGARLKLMNCNALKNCLFLALVSGALLAARAGAAAAQSQVRAWGLNSSGELGDGTTFDSLTPIQVSGLTDVVAVQAASGRFSLALKADGTVWTWGANYLGQLGNGTNTESYVPVQVIGLMDVVNVSSNTQTLAVKSDGTLWAWGDNEAGKLGDGTTINRNAPVQVRGPGGIGYFTGAIAAAAGGSHSLALRADGTVWAWGPNGNGALGNGTTMDSLYPVQVFGLTNIVAIAAGGQHSLALRSDGTVWAWGLNHVGQLGNGTSTFAPNPFPTQVIGLPPMIAIACGDSGAHPSGSAGHSMALAADGHVWTWGNNAAGELGDGTTFGHTVPVLVTGVENVAAIASGGGSSLALKTDGTLWCWGSNDFGQLGDGTTTNRTVPIQVAGLTGVGTMSGGRRHTLAVVGSAVTNRPPVANAGPGFSVACTHADGTPVTLDGSGSSDPDGDPLTYTWTGPFPEGGGVVHGLNPTVTLPLGLSTLSLVVNDGRVDSAPATVAIRVTVRLEGFLPPLAALVPYGGTPPVPQNAFKQGRTAPLKLRLFCGDVALTDQEVAPPRLVGLQRNGNPVPLDTIDPDPGEANDNGILFRYAAPNWVYNLSTANLKTGTYTVVVELPDGRYVVASFVLR